MKLEITGLKEMQRLLDQRAQEIGEDIPESFIANGLRMIEAHTAPYVPVDTSALINSAVRQMFGTAEGAVGELSYGGTAQVDYATYVHEGPQRNWQKAGASNKFLEKGVQDFITEDLDILIDAEFGKVAR